MRVPNWLALTGLALLVVPSGARAQSEQGTWSVEVSTGAQAFAESSALTTSPMLAIEALYQIAPRISIGPAIQFIRAETDGTFFVAALDFGADSTRIFEVGQTLTSLQYGGNVHVDLMPGNQLAPYLIGGAGGYTLYLDAQANDGFTRVSHLMFQGGGGVRYAVTESAGIQLDVRDVIYKDFDRDLLNPVAERLRNCSSSGSCRFPDAERATTPDKQDMIHNIRFSIGLTYIPGLNR